MTGSLIERFGYLGIVLLLVLGGLGLPVPEEAPVLMAAYASRRGSMWWPLAVLACFLGVLVGDFLVYFLGYAYGEKVTGFRLTRKFLTKAREAQIKGYFHRHGPKILIVGRFAPGFRTAAYLTAGILRLPPIKLLLADMLAATISTSLLFGAGYFFADKIESGLKDAQRYAVPAVGVVVGLWLLHRYYKARLRAGQLVGPPVPVTDEVPIPPDDLHPPPSREGLSASAIARQGPVVVEDPGPGPAPSPAAPPPPPPPAPPTPIPSPAPPASTPPAAVEVPRPTIEPSPSQPPPPIIDRSSQGAVEGANTGPAERERLRVGGSIG